MAHDACVLNKKLKIGSTIFTIIGVAPPEFFGTKVCDSPDIWIPLSMQKEVPPNFDGYTGNFSESLYLMGRLKPGTTMTQAATNVNLLFRQILLGFPDAPVSQENLEKLKKTRVVLSPMTTGLSSLRRKFSEPLKILMIVVALVLLIACANIANLLLARSTARTREFAVRQALGARRSRLIRQLLTESLVLALTGGALGVGFAAGASRLLLHMVSGGQATVPLDVSLNIRLLLFTLAITCLTAVLFGMIPAFRATKLELTESLKDGRGQTSAGAKNRLAKALVIAQVAFSLVLLVASGLFLRSLINLTNVDTGFNRETVLRLQTDASSIGYAYGNSRLLGLYQQIEDRVSAVPGVSAASNSLFTYNEGSWNTRVSVHGYDADRNRNIKHNIVGNGYFATMGIPLLAGRTFGPQDSTSSPKVAVISDIMARTMFPRGSPIWHHSGVGGPEPPNVFELIGIVKDVKFG